MTTNTRANGITHMMTKGMTHSITAILLLVLVGYSSNPAGVIKSEVVSSRAGGLQTPTGTASATASDKSTRGFVTRSGAQLLLDGRPFRFSGPNIYWLALDEKGVEGVDYPTEFRVNDVLATAKELGATVVRSHAAISTGCDKCIEPTLGRFNEQALRRLDYAVMMAGEYDLRLILPFTDNYRYYHGGKHNFTQWRSLDDEEAFYTNQAVIDDYKQYISTIINRPNTYTGIAYKDDPTIIAWETGNELHPPVGWTQTIADYIKQLDRNHLVVDGSYGVQSEALSLNHVDIYSDHFYPLSNARLASGAALAAAANKAYVVGEYDWSNTSGGDGLADFLGALERQPAVSGDTFWTLWGHDDRQGYVVTDTRWDLHYPASTPDRRLRAQQLRSHAYAMQSKAAPPPGPVAAPTLTSAAGALTWRGVAGADRYTIERSTSGFDGSWTVICDQCATDTDLPWVDASSPAMADRVSRGTARVMLPMLSSMAGVAQRGQQASNGGNTSASQPTDAWYRVKAHNLAGEAGAYSPIYFSSASGFADNLNDWTMAERHSANLSFDTTTEHFFEGDRARAYRGQARTPEELVWFAPGLRDFEAITYFWPFETVSHFDLLTSSDGIAFTRAAPTIRGTPAHWFTYTYTLANLANVNYIKMRWNNEQGQPWSPQIGRVRTIQGTVNHALGARVVASSSLETADHGIVSVNDGVRNATTGRLGWSSTSAANPNQAEAITFDLGAVRTLHRVDLYPRNDMGNVGSGFPENFTIQVGDGANWTTVITQRDYSRPAGIAQSFSFPTQTARYVKITGTRLRNELNDIPGYVMQVAEVEIY